MYDYSAFKETPSETADDQIKRLRDAAIEAEVKRRIRVDARKEVDARMAQKNPPPATGGGGEAFIKFIVYGGAMLFVLWFVFSMIKHSGS